MKMGIWVRVTESPIRAMISVTEAIGVGLIGGTEESRLYIDI